MEVADEVKEELQGHDLLFVVGGRICQLRGELIDLVDDAVGGRAVRGHGSRRQRRMVEAGFVDVRRVDLDVNEVPLSRTIVAKIIAELSAVGQEPEVKKRLAT